MRIYRTLTKHHSFTFHALDAHTKPYSYITYSLACPLLISSPSRLPLPGKEQLRQTHRFNATLDIEELILTHHLLAVLPSNHLVAIMFNTTRKRTHATYPPIHRYSDIEELTTELGTSFFLSTRDNTTLYRTNHLT